MKESRFKSVIAAALLVSAALATVSPAVAGNTQDSINDLADRYYRFRLESQPEVAYFSGVELKRHDGLYDNRPEAISREQATEDRLFGELQQIDEADLRGSPAWITHGFLKEALVSVRALRVCRNELWGVSQVSGWQLGYTQIAAMQPVGNTELRQQALDRWKKFPAWIDQEILNLRAGLASGYSSPRAAVRRVIDQLDGTLALPAPTSPFASPAQRDDDDAFRRVFMTLVEAEILPAVRRYRDFLAVEYLEQARTGLAVTGNIDGAACYQASLRSYTTLDRSAQDVYDLGRQTVAMNRARVEELGKAIYGLHDLVRIIERIGDDPADKFSDAAELLSFSESVVIRARDALPAWFGYIPKRDALVEPYPEYQDGTGVSARYEPGTASRAGVYRIPLFEPRKQSRGNAEATAFHEVWPGHHLQVSVAQEIKGLHPVTRISWYSGMSEGWARYSESLADEMGLYTTVSGPILRLAWPARGMVVDPGIHLMGWSREQAVEFMGRAGRMTAAELDQMVDRIAVLPGQLTSYDSGGLEILALRRLAEEKLGEDFDIRSFHDRILENGTVPLDMLRLHIESWISERVSH